MNQGIHAVDLLQWIAGLPEEMSAFAAKLSHTMIEAEDTVAAILRYPHGGLGVIEAATSAWPGDDLRIEVVGDRGSATLVNDSLVRWEFADALPEDESVRRDLSQGTLKVGSSDPRGMSWEGHRLLVGDLARALLEGRPPMIPGAEARRAVQLVLAIYESAQTGRPVRLLFCQNLFNHKERREREGW